MSGWFLSERYVFERMKKEIRNQDSTGEAINKNMLMKVEVKDPKGFDSFLFRWRVYFLNKSYDILGLLYAYLINIP